MIAICHRYGLKKDVLKCFDNSRMKWFRDPKKYWYEEIFERFEAYQALKAG